MSKDDLDRILWKRRPFTPDTIRDLPDGAGIVVLWAKGNRVLRIVEVTTSVRSELVGTIQDSGLGDFEAHGGVVEFSAVWEEDHTKRAALAKKLKDGLEELAPD